jgi:hypothetical protein
MAGSHQKLALTPLQNDILWLLEEAGSETLLTVLTTLIINETITASDSILYDVESAVRSLIRVGFLTMTKDIEKPGSNDVLVTPDELKSLQNLRSILDWNERKRCWTWNTDQGGPHPISLVLTPEGFAALNR